MDYMFSQHDLSFLDDVIPEKDKKKKEDEKTKKRGSMDSDAEDVREPWLAAHIAIIVSLSVSTLPSCSLTFFQVPSTGHTASVSTVFFVVLNQTSSSSLQISPLGSRLSQAFVAALCDITEAKSLSLKLVKIHFVT